MESCDSDAHSLPSRAGRRRSTRLALVTLSLSFLLSFSLVLANASDAFAQPVVGVPGMKVRDPTMNAWEINKLLHTDVTLADVKRSYKGAIEDLQNGNCRTATAKLDFVLDHIKKDPNLYYVAATARRCTQQFRIAADLYETAIELDETYYSAYRYLGISHLALGEFEEATDQLGLLESERVACGPDCDASLVESAQALRKAIEIARSIAAQQARDEP